MAKRAGSSGVFILVILALFLFFTNPTTEEFANWAVNEANEGASEFENLLGNMIGKPVLKAATQRKDYYLFSIFTVALDEETKVIGVGRWFFEISSSQ